MASIANFLGDVFCAIGWEVYVECQSIPVLMLLVAGFTLLRGNTRGNVCKPKQHSVETQTVETLSISSLEATCEVPMPPVDLSSRGWRVAGRVDAERHPPVVYSTKTGKKWHFSKDCHHIRTSQIQEFAACKDCTGRL